MYRYYFKYLKKYWIVEAFLFLLLLLTSAFSLATPYILKVIIDDIIPRRDYQELVNILLVLTLIYLFRIVSSFLSDTVYVKLSKKIVSDIRTDLFLNILTKELSFFKNSKPGEIIFLLTNDVENIQDAISSLLLQVLNNLLTITGILVMLTILDYKLALLSIVVVPLILIVIRMFTPYIKHSFEKTQGVESEIYNYFLERIRNIRVLKTYNNIGFEKTIVDKLNMKFVGTHLTNTFFRASSNSLTTFLIAIGPVAVLMYGGKQIFLGAMTLGSLIAFIQYLNRLYRPTISLVASFNDFVNAQVSMGRVYKYADESKIPDSRQGFEIENLQSLNMRGVTLKYNRDVILNNICLNLYPGKIYGVVGANGVGKSSLINLICGFIAPSKGSVYVNNQIDIKDVSNWTNHIALVEKENQLFFGDIMFNVTYGVDDKRDNQIENAITESFLKTVLEKLEHGEKTVISSSGSPLSDGQRQRISLARALLKDSSILIFDEGTSSFDIDLEEKILSHLKSHNMSKIIILVTHRVNSLKFCDHVLKIDGGRIFDTTSTI